MLREVQLLPEFADEYPELTPGRWYTAAAVAGHVKAVRLVDEGADVRLPERLLDPARFHFRGGSPRHGIWVGTRTRRVDRLAMRGTAEARETSRPRWGTAVTPPRFAGA